MASCVCKMGVIAIRSPFGSHADSPHFKLTTIIHYTCNHNPTEAAPNPTIRNPATALNVTCSYEERKAFHSLLDTVSAVAR